MSVEAPYWWKHEPARPRRDREAEPKVVPLSRAYPVGLFEDPSDAECPHSIRVECEVDLHGISRPLPAERCVRCRAVEVLRVKENV